MKHLIRETLQQASQESPALPFSVLVARLRAQGAAVTEGVLARLLSEPGSGARLVDPWRGPHRALRSYLPGIPGEDGLWVVLEADEEEDPEPDPPCAARLRSALLRLGAELDTRSPGDVARWIALVEEARRLPRAA